MTEMALLEEEILDTKQTVVKVSRTGNEVINHIFPAIPMSLVGGLAAFLFGAPLEFIIGATAVTGIGVFSSGTYLASKKLAGDYIEMICRRRSELTRKEELQAWTFFPGKETARKLEEFYVNERGTTFSKKLKNGLFYGMPRVEKAKATHKVTNEIRSSWRGAKIIQTIEPVDSYLWQQAYIDTKMLYEIQVPASRQEFDKGTTIAERIKAIEAQNVKTS